MALLPELGELRELDLAGGRLRVHVRGDGSPILLLHGFFTNASLWRGVVPLLASEHCCITPDLPMGFHSAALEEGADLSLPGLAGMLADALDELGIDRITVVGNDLGGALAQVFTAQHPDRVARLVLTPSDSFGNCPAHMLKPLRLLCFIPGFVTAATVVFRLARVRRFVHRMSSKRAVADDVLLATYVPALANPEVRRDLVAFVRALSPRHTRRAARALEGFDRPAAVVWTQTVWFPMSHARRLAELLGGWLHVVSDSGAFLPEDQPQELAEIVRRLERIA
jgi:pimeloyl-ACP methyl ester carboxylesterase